MLELIIVLVILAMTTAVVLPRFSRSFEGLSFNQAVATLTTDLRYAQARAITQRQMVQVAVMEGAPSGYRLFVKTVEAPDFVPLPGRFGRRRTLPRDTSLAIRAAEGPERTPAAVTFYPDGQADPSLVVLSDARHQSVTLTVDEATGHVEVAPATHAP